jgi:hypothetical protein
MRIKHYLLIILTLILIAFFQPLVIFLGNLLVIVAAGAYIYSDMKPEAQDAYERKLTNALHKVRRSLRGRKAEVHQLPVGHGSRLSRMFGRSAPTETEPAVRHTNERH